MAIYEGRCKVCGRNCEVYDNGVCLTCTRLEKLEKQVKGLEKIIKTLKKR